MRRRVRPGTVTVPAGLRVEVHELATAVRLARFGADIVFRERTEIEGRKNPDVVIDGVIWEFKSPKGSSGKSTIASQFKRSRRQAVNVVIDLARCGLSDDLAFAQIARRFYGQKQIKQLLVIDHRGIVRCLML